MTTEIHATVPSLFMGQLENLLSCDINQGGLAGKGNRTLVSSLGSWRSTIELHPQHDFRFSDADLRFASPRFDLNYETHQLRTFRKRALRAIGRVAQTKILVNLQKALLTGESPQKFSLPR